MQTKYDVIIIGAGPNGLEAGTYLSKAGEKVLILEHRYECGGGLWTEEPTLPGYLFSTHAVYMMMVDFAPVYSDLRLEEDYQVKHIYPDLQFAMPLLDGRCLCLYKDVERTCKSFAQFSQKDAESYREFYKLTKRCMDEFIGPATFVPPMGALDQIVRLKKTEIGRIVMEFSEKKPIDIIQERFENEHIRTLLLYLACHWGVKYDQINLGYLVLLYLNRAHNHQLVKGGSHMVAQALNKVIHQNHGLVKNNQRIKKIIVESGEAKGVEMIDGTVYEATKAVISTIDPLQTFIDLIGTPGITEAFAKKIKNWKWESYSLFGAHSALKEPPQFKAAENNPDINRSCVYLLGYEKLEDLIKHFDALYKGELSEIIGYNASFPGVHDPQLAPQGRCTSQLSMMAPFRLKEGPEKWYNLRFKEELAGKCQELLGCYAPNLTKDKFLQTYISTPLDMQNKFADMQEGSYKQGAYIPFQMGFLRPNEDCSRNRTPVKKLYLGGASVYPGGCVIWGPGYLAANTVAQDLGIEKWWKEPEFVTRGREAGIL
ncbi:MAG TPA: NAD(P)/FAD-dependent oxidoreductase [Thermodesulfobacteriota bacterium]|nr:NAD(P)/FAD-dependent oxidoreductase [Thermodesulfobacteriota bacterium]